MLAGKGDDDKAIADFTMTIRLIPDFAAVYNDRGTVYRRKKQYEKAIEDFTEAIRADRKNAVAYHNRGLTWGVQGQFSLAIDDFSEAIRLAPSMPEPITAAPRPGRARETATRPTPITRPPTLDPKLKKKR